MKTPTAAIVIVGNEVLSAKVEDENGPYATKALRALGVQVSAVLILPDVLEVIEEAVARERARVDWLFTSGGVGPTHDDVTVAAVSLALGRPLARDPAMADLVAGWHRRSGREPPEAALRMADLPVGTRLVGEGYPVMVVENVVMLPGPPRFFRLQFDRFAQTLASEPFRMTSLYVAIGEDHFARMLERVALKYPEVMIGSYPRFDDADHRVRVTFESKDVTLVEAAADAFAAELPAGAIVRREPV